MKVFKVPYWISNNGDGSASIRLEKSLEIAEQKEEEQCEGWGESCCGEIKLTLIDGKLYFKEYDYKIMKYIQVEVPTE